jgi:hypothetical protein
MLRDKLIPHHVEKGFRLRGGEIARIEGLSDAVFAFAVTLLVVSLEVPKTFNELAVIMRGFVPFALSFGLLMRVWHEQYIFFRRYNLQDTVTIMLNLALLFMVLFYVYPLKFLFTVLLNGWTGVGNQIHLPNGEVENAIEPGQLSSLMKIFSGGYLAVSLVFMAMFYRALRKAKQLELNPLEIFETRATIGSQTLQGAVAFISLLIVMVGGESQAAMAGVIYPILLGPGFTIFHTILGRKRRQAEA